MKRNFIMTQDERAKFQEWIVRIAGCPEKVKGTATGKVLDDLLLSPGKMIRPGLLFACASLGPKFKENLHNERIYLLGALVELTHLSSLVHDDIIDDAPLRRGQLSIQGKYGKDAAVYAGDYIISRINYWEAKEHCNDAAVILSKTVEDMCIGEIGQAMCRYHTRVSCKEYYDNIKGKTASLFQAACKIGAMAGGCDQETVRVLERFGEHIGIIFQLRDDLIDFSEKSLQEGKETHKDFQDGIYTLPVLMAMRSEEGRKELLPIMDENFKRVLDKEEIKKMEEIVIRYHGVEDTWKEIRQRANMCKDILGMLGNNEIINQLYSLIELLTDI